MEQIKLQKQRSNIRESGVQVRVAEDINQRLMYLSEETGLSKQYITDKLLRVALDNVVVTD